MDAAQEVKARLNIEDVIGEYVQLKRSGRNFKGLSPWTNEKTPSFIVSPEKQIWHDFSSGRGGDVISFVMEMEGLDFKATLEVLARRAGVDLEQFARPGQPAQRPKAYILKALDIATRFYQKQLVANRPALEYLLKKRGFSKATVIEWRLGYSPKIVTAVSDFLSKQGFDMHEVKLSGLAGERSGRTYDMFRGRIMIPLCDSRGQVIGFTARLLGQAADSPKYINTPQTLVYDKSRHIFGLHLAKEAIRKQAYVVVVEGNLDVIASHQAGVRNVVASAGTAITEQHLRQLKRFTGDIRLCFDADRAGIEATIRAIPLAQKVGVDLSIISLKDAKDPDELLQKDVKAWQAAIDERLYAPDWVIERYREQLDLSTAQGKRDFSDAVLAVVWRLQDSIEQEHYLKKIAELTDTSFESVKAKFDRTESQGTFSVRRRQLKVSAELDRQAVEYQRLQDHFLAMVLFAPKLRDLLDELDSEYFKNDSASKIYEFLSKNPDYGGGQRLPKQLQPFRDYVKILSLQFEELYQGLPAADLAEQAAGLRQRLIGKYTKIEKSRLARLMEETTDEKQLKKLIKKVDQLNKLIK